MAEIIGGNKLEAYLKELSKKVTNVGVLEVGFLEGATYPDGTPVPLIAATNEFGRPAHNQPPRPYFRRMVAKGSKQWGDDIAKLLPAQGYNAQTTLELMGHEIKGQLQQSIQELVSPPLAESTIVKKGFDKPLIDTSHMINRVDFQVKDSK